MIWGIFYFILLHSSAIYRSVLWTASFLMLQVLSSPLPPPIVFYTRTFFELYVPAVVYPLQTHQKLLYSTNYKKTSILSLSQFYSTSNNSYKHCQRHNGPEGWVHITRWRFTVHKSWTYHNIRISIKHLLQDQHLD